MEGGREEGRGGGQTFYLHVYVRLVGEAVLGEKAASICDLAEADAHQVLCKGQTLCCHDGRRKKYEEGGKEGGRKRCHTYSRYLNGSDAGAGGGCIDSRALEGGGRHGG